MPAILETTVSAIVVVPCELLNAFSLDGTAPAAPVVFDADCAPVIVIPAPVAFEL
jgi:hypothetical protein